MLPSGSLQRGDEVVGFDVVNAYYDPQLRIGVLALLDEAATIDRRIECPGRHSLRPCQPRRQSCRRRNLPKSIASTA